MDIEQENKELKHMLDPMMMRNNRLTQKYEDIKQKYKDIKQENEVLISLLEPMLEHTHIPTLEENEQEENIPKEREQDEIIPKESEQDVDKVENRPEETITQVSDSTFDKPSIEKHKRKKQTKKVIDTKKRKRKI